MDFLKIAAFGQEIVFFLHHDEILEQPCNDKFLIG